MCELDINWVIWSHVADVVRVKFIEAGQVWSRQTDGGVGVRRVSGASVVHSGQA